MRVLRTYVLQHIETTEQATELLRDLAKVNPHAFTEALQAMAATDKKQRIDSMVREIEQHHAEMQEQLAEVRRRSGNAEARTPTRAAKGHKKRARALRPALLS